MPVKAKLQITTVVRNGKTTLKQSFCTHPFKLANITEDRRSAALHLMIRSSSPGVLDEDEYDIQLAIAAKGSVVLQTQSYQRLFLMKRGASQTMEVMLSEEASLQYLPHPIVPHAGSIFSSHNKIYLSNRCTLIWGEVLSCGRKENGELFQFTSYHAITEIFQEGKLVVKENLWLIPASGAVTGIGQLEGYSHQATLLYIKEDIDCMDLVSCLVSLLQNDDTISFGVSQLPVNGIIVRLLGYKADQLFTIVNQLAHYIENKYRITTKFMIDA